MRVESGYFPGNFLPTISLKKMSGGAALAVAILVLTQPAPTEAFPIGLAPLALVLNPLGISIAAGALIICGCGVLFIKAGVMTDLPDDVKQQLRNDFSKNPSHLMML